jgi:hypothetical protein
VEQLKWLDCGPEVRYDISVMAAAIFVVLASKIFSARRSPSVDLAAVRSWSHGRALGFE